MSMRGFDFAECPDCGETVLAGLLDVHRAEECPGEERTCPVCGEGYEHYTRHMTGGCPGPE